MPILKERRLQPELIYWERASWKGRMPVQIVEKLENDYKFGGRIRSLRITFIAEPLFGVNEISICYWKLT
jgi:hypothetical protein